MASSAADRGDGASVAESTTTGRHARRRRCRCAPRCVVSCAAVGPRASAGCSCRCRWSSSPPSRSADDDGGRPGARGFVDLAQESGANLTVFTLFASTGFLLVVVVALFAGDSVPSEASWSSLRYLLAAPVPRTRLLRQKLVVAGAVSACRPGASCRPGRCWSAGSRTAAVPTSARRGDQIGWPQLLGRFAVVVVYLLSR